MKRYLLDTNIYIDAYDRYYRNEYFPTFWEKFEITLNEHVVIPKVVKDEITKSDWFHEWLDSNFQDDILNHKVYAEQWQAILDFIKSSGLYKDRALSAQVTGWANENIVDPWLVAIAKEENLIVVSEEIRNPNLDKGNPIKSAKVPDICDRQGVRCIGRNEFFGEIGLSV
jgi:hypothetical protein